MKYSILHVDDDVVFCRVVKQVLNRDGFNVCNVHNGSNAWDLLSTISFDCYLLDISMPGMDGISLGQLIRARYPWTPIVFFTGENPEQIWQEVYGRGGGTGLISKYASMMGLAPLLNKHIISHHSLK
ncbi:response regulator [Chitinophaga sp. 30R24]|uniref:response regulator n=1 Tax=Chitinophaga sp. 30R24 TaxID=3248838 RepID=UPI003B90A820